MPFLSSRFSSLSNLLNPGNNYFSVVFESPGTYLLEGELSEFLTMDIYAWGGGGGSAYGVAGGGGAFVKLGGVIPPDGSSLEISVGGAGSNGGTRQGQNTSTTLYYTNQTSGRIEWSDFLRQYAVWDGNGDYIWKAYFPDNDNYIIRMSADDTAKMYIDNVLVHQTGNTAPALTTTMTITADGAGGGAGGKDAGTPGANGLTGARVTGTFDMTLGVDTINIDLGDGGQGGYDGRGPGSNQVVYSSAVIPNTLLGAASLTASTPASPGALTFTGWEDDGYWNVPLPWRVTYNQSEYGSVYVSTNSLLTFGGASLGNWQTDYYPQFDKIMISAGDNSCQRIYYGTEGSAPNRTFRIRWEGTNVGAIDTEAYYRFPGTYSWTCPPGVTSVAVVMVGGGGGASEDESGGGGGGGLAYKNNVTVTPGQTYTVIVGRGGSRGSYGQKGGKGGDSSAFNVIAYGGRGTGDPNPGYGGTGGGFNANADGGGVGGAGGDGNRSTISDTGRNSGGGGAGGYTGNGGRGADHNTNNQTAGTGGAGGGGANGGPGEYGGGGGGGTGLFGLGANGVAGTPGSESVGGGGGGSGGSRGGPNRDSYYGGSGGFPGGGGGADDGPGGVGAGGAVRILYNFTGETARAFPSTNVGTTLRRTGGTLGSPNMIWEAIFYENRPSQFDIQIGANARGTNGQTGIYSYDSLISRLPADNNFGLRFTRTQRGGDGVAGGSGLIYRFFNLVEQANVTKSSGMGGFLNGTWLNTFGVWEVSRTAAQFDRTYTFNIPFDGYYRLVGACDDYGYVFIDGTRVLFIEGFQQLYTQVLSLTAGSHTIRILGYNTGGPGSIGVFLEKSFAGANSGSAGNSGSSGAGGGGGGATVVRKNFTTFLAVAAGGGGGGGAGNGPPGLAPAGRGLTVDWTAGTGENKIGDGGGGGAGGGGVQGGLGGLTVSGDTGAYSGERGSSWATGLTGGATALASNGGVGYTSPGGKGRVVISYETPTGAQLYQGGTVTRVGNIITHTFTESGVLKAYANAGYAFFWDSALVYVQAGWRTIKINAQNIEKFAGVAAWIRQNSTANYVWNTRDERDPTAPGTGRSLYAGPSSYSTEGSNLPLTLTTPDLWMSNRNAGYTTVNSGTYSITREFYAPTTASYRINYMVSRAAGATLSNVTVYWNGTVVGTNTSVSATPNSFTRSLGQGYHTIRIAGNTGVSGTTQVYAALEVDYTAQTNNLPLYSLRQDYVARNNFRGGRGGPAYDSDGDSDGPFSGADGGGASVVKLNGMTIVVAGGGGGGGGSGDDYWTRSEQYGGGGRGEITIDGNSAGLNGSGPYYAGGGGGGGGGIVGGAGGAQASYHWPGNGGQGGVSFINRRIGNTWQVVAGNYNSPGGTDDIAYKGNFGYSQNSGRVVIVFQRRPHIWQKISGKWQRFDSLSWKENSSRSQNILNLSSGDNWTPSNQVQVRYYTEVTGMATPLTQAIGGAVAIFGWMNTNTTVGQATRILSSRRKIDLRAFRYLWYQVNRGTVANWGEEPDPGENIKLQYSTDNLKWIDLDNVAPTNVTANVWTTRVPAIPEVVYRNADGVFLRFYQEVSYDLGYPIRDTWAVTSIVGLANYAEASNDKKGFDQWKPIAEVYVKADGKWKRVYAPATTSSTPTPTRYG